MADVDVARAVLEGQGVCQATGVERRRAADQVVERRGPVLTVEGHAVGEVVRGACADVGRHNQVGARQPEGHATEIAAQARGHVPIDTLVDGFSDVGGAIDEGPVKLRFSTRFGDAEQGAVLDRIGEGLVRRHSTHRVADIDLPVVGADTKFIISTSHFSFET